MYGPYQLKFSAANLAVSWETINVVTVMFICSAKFLAPCFPAFETVLLFSLLPFFLSLWVYALNIYKYMYVYLHCITAILLSKSTHHLSLKL